MKKIIGALAAVLAIILFYSCAQSNNNLPRGWYTPNKPSEYEVGIDNSTFEHGHSCAFIKSKSPVGKDFGNLMQVISAQNYLGKRLRLSGYIKTKDVEQWCGMWMRVDGEGSQLKFDNMVNRPIKGTTDWKKYEIVLDVPENSKTINYGSLLPGRGEVWFDNFKLEEVDKSIPVTNINYGFNLPEKPVNLDFEE